MLLLILFAFIAGIVTILSPCILPVLPIVLLGSISEGKKRPLGIIVGFISSFTFFTLFLAFIVSFTGISPNVVRNLSVVIIAFFGLTLVIPKASEISERLFSKLVVFTPKNTQSGFKGGALIGLSLGLLWTPCVGPILASVIALAATGVVNGSTFLITFSYSLGTAIPLFAIMVGGKSLLSKAPYLTTQGKKIQQIFGVIMIVTAVGIALNFDRKFQTFILNKFPQYGSGLTQIEQNPVVINQLDQLNNNVSRISSTDLVSEGPAPELIPGGKWFNASPATIASMKGKVILVDFWTYTCINCIRTLPYIEQWYEKYKDQGFVVIGVHTPEFEFEKDPDNVAKAIKDFGLTYPIVQDNNYATWRAYNNQYWPAKYLVDKDGNIRFTHFGEGMYDETEKAITALLRETGKNTSDDIHNFSYTVTAQTPETYFGYSKTERYAGTPQIVKDTAVEYSAPLAVPTDNYSYTGSVTVGPEYALMNKNSTMTFSFQAQDMFLVMRPTSKSSTVKVYLDGTFQNSITVDEDRLYEIAKLPKMGIHTVRLEFPDGQVQVYASTFG